MLLQDYYNFTVHFPHMLPRQHVYTLGVERIVESNVQRILENQSFLSVFIFLHYIELKYILECANTSRINFSMNFHFRQ